jgi:hypothetical protein
VGAMSTIYRKSGRKFYRIVDDREVMRVVLKFDLVGIDRSRENYLILGEAKDEYYSEVSAEEEFNTAYKEAMERIQSGRLDVHERD